MKKALLFVLALIAVGCAEPIPRNLGDLVQQGEETWLDRETMRPYSGPVFRFLPNDTTRVQLSANLKDGKYDGPFEMYHENGQLQSRSTANMGEIDGPVETYYENGQLQERSIYTAGELDGPAESYHENGQLQEKVVFVAGDRDGPHDTYYANGQLQDRGTYNMGRRCGEWIQDGETVTYDPCPPDLADGN